MSNVVRKTKVNIIILYNIMLFVLKYDTFWEEI